VVDIAQVVGTAYVRLRLLTDAVGKDIKKSVEKSGLQDVDLHVNADTADADAQLEATGLLADKLDRKDPTIKPKVDTKQAQKETHLLRDALVTLGPTIGPLGGAATAAFAAVGAGAGVAVLAVLGVKKEMKDATQTGVAFSGGLQALKADLSTLERTAARGVLPGFQTTVTALHGALPGVNASVQTLSRELGDIGGHVVVGLVAGLRTFEPLLQHVAQYADQAAAHFEKWATGAGGAQFGATFGHEFDQVIPVLGHLVETVGKVVSAFAPIGGQVVGVIGTLSEALNVIPLPILEALATTFVTLYTARRLTQVFNSIGTALGKMGTEGALANTQLARFATGAQAVVSRTGLILAFATAAYQAGRAVGEFYDRNNSAVKSFKNSASAQQSYTDALISSKGALDDGVKTSIVYQLQQDKLASKAAKAGIGQDQLTTAVTGTTQQFEALIATWKASGKPADDTIAAIEQVRTDYNFAVTAAWRYRQQQDALVKSPAWKTLQTTADSVQQVADKYHITTDAVKSYAGLLGISGQAIKTGVITNKDLASAVHTVEIAYNTATMAGTAFLSAQAQFASSTGTSADRAQFLGSFLKALQGDMLGYQGAVASAYAANTNLITSFKQEADQVKAGSLALTDTMKAAINLKTGLIDVSKAGAGPLIQSLQGMQDAAMAAASATYQHEVATKGAGKAASDAAKIFKGETYDALVKDAAQLGLTSGEAKKLADKYFALPKDVATKVKTIGTDPVVTVLNKIGALLAYMAGKPWDAKVAAPGAKTAKDQINGVNDAVHGLHGKDIRVGADTTAAKRALRDLQAGIDSMRNQTLYVTAHTSLSGGHGKLAGGFASGTGRKGLPDGMFTVGERGFEVGYKRGPHVDLYSNQDSRAMMGVSKLPGYAGGTISAAGAQQLRIRIDSGDLSRLRKALAGTASQIASSMARLIGDLNKAVAASGGGSRLVDAVERDNAKLLRLANDRARINLKLKAANEKLAALRQASAEEAAKVSAAIRSGFDVTSAGQAVGREGVPESSAASILSQLKSQVADAKRFADQLALLRKRGLSKGLLQQLGEAGVAGAGTNVSALASASAAQLKAINAAFAQLGYQGNRAGATVAGSMYAAQISSTRQVVAALDRQRAHDTALMDRLVRQIDHLARALADRPVRLVANGQALAKVVNDANLRNARR
jgi:hypothetical protein